MLKGFNCHHIQNNFSVLNDSILSSSRVPDITVISSSDSAGLTSSDGSLSGISFSRICLSVSLRLIFHSVTFSFVSVKSESKSSSASSREVSVIETFTSPPKLSVIFSAIGGFKFSVASLVSVALSFSSMRIEISFWF